MRIRCIKRAAFGAIGAAALLLSGVVSAAPQQWTVASGGNGHWYEYVSGTPSWEAAVASAASMSHLGMTGYLATITSDGENGFLNALSGSVGWVGGTDSGVEGTWLWATGPEAGTVFWKDGSTLTYANWNGGEPNNSGNEDFLVIKQLPGWNDAPTSYAGAFYVEYSAVVPEPATALLLPIGLAAVGLFTRRRPRA